ncbi:MAG: AhpC/TSA family protein [Bacteroidales bacterium]|jgi:thiol-disulfide isomerase/thioredoxin|nr:AhpC/TSA family protein [Bacteroidales bacterium]
MINIKIEPRTDTKRNDGMFQLRIKVGTGSDRKFIPLPLIVGDPSDWEKTTETFRIKKRASTLDSKERNKQYEKNNLYVLKKIKKNKKHIVMKKTFLYAALVSLCLACAEKSTETTIKITAKNYNAEIITIGWVEDEDFKVEQLTLENGKAEIVVNVPEGEPIVLMNNDPRNQIDMEDGVVPGVMFMFYAEKGTITISFDADHWPALTIKGGPLNNDLNRFHKDMAPLEAKQFEIIRRSFAGEEEEEDKLMIEMENLQKEMTLVREQFIRKNPNSLHSVQLLAMIQRELELDEFEALFNTLSKKMKQTEQAASIAEVIEKTRAMQSGMPAPAFTKKDKNGNTVSLSDHLGQYVLLDFWGTWCGACRQSHPKLVEMYKKYSPLGLVFINIAFEGGNSEAVRERWLKAIADDGLVWTNILNDEGKDECDVISLYNISAFPTKILIDPQGKFVATWVGSTPEAEEKLKEIFGL